MNFENDQHTSVIAAGGQLHFGDGPNRNAVQPDRSSAIHAWRLIELHRDAIRLLEILLDLRETENEHETRHHAREDEQADAKMKLPLVHRRFLRTTNYPLIQAAASSCIRSPASPRTNCETRLSSESNASSDVPSKMIWGASGCSRDTG